MISVSANFRILNNFIENVMDLMCFMTKTDLGSLKIFHLYNDLLVISFSMECPEAMERGRNFRLLAKEELPKLLDFLDGYLPESLKVRSISF